MQAMSKGKYLENGPVRHARDTPYTFLRMNEIHIIFPDRIKTVLICSCHLLSVDPSKSKISILFGIKLGLCN